MIELRAGWLLLGVLLAVTCRPASAPFVALWAITWLTGAVRLSGAGGSCVVAGVVELLRDTTVRMAFVLLAGVLAGVGLAFGAFASLVLLTCVGASAILLLSAGSVRRARTLLVGGALSGTGVVLCLWLAEALLSLPPIANHFGTPRARSAWDAAYDSSWSRNILGLRSSHERVMRTPEVMRVVALGDSYTWGDKIQRTDSTWPGLLERRLSADGRAVEVVNLGQRGFTLANEGEQLRRLGWQFDPDVVVWQFFVNDALWSGPNFARDGEKWTSLLPTRFRQGAAGRSALLYLLERAVNQALRGRDGARAYAPLYAEGAPGWVQLASALAEGADSARARGVPIVLVLYPAFVPGTWTRETYPLRAEHAKVRSAAAARGIAVLDLTEVFVAQGGDWKRWWALPWDSHPNAAAHALAADAIAAQLLATPPAHAAMTTGPRP